MTIPVSGRGDRTTKVVAAATLSVTLVLAGLLHNVAHDSATSVLDARWRGAYDILVTSAANPGSSSDIDTRLMPPYAIATAAERLALSDLEAVRSVHDVELAAPIGDALVRSAYDGPHLMFQVPYDAANEHLSPTPLRVSTTLTVNEGARTRTLHRTSYDVVLDASGGSSLVMLRDGEVVSASDCESDPAEEACAAVQRVPVSYSRAGETDDFQSSGIIDDDKLLFELPVLTEAFPHVLFVDPKAESQLLGNSGDFLEPLLDVGSGFGVNDLRRINRDAPADEHSKRVSEWLQSIAPVEAAWETPGSVRSPNVIPLVVGSGTNIDAELEVAVESQFGGAPQPIVDNDSGLLRWRLPPAMRSGERGQERSLGRFGVGALLEAADPATMVLPLPGIDQSERVSSPPPRISRISAWAFTSQLLPSDVGGVPTLRIDNLLSPTEERTGGTGSRTWLAFGSDLRPESEAVAHEIIHSETIPEAHQPLVVAVGTIDWSRSDSATTQTVPLASIGRSETRLVIDSKGQPTSELIAPSLAGLGVASSRPTAFASIYTAGALGIDTPISSVRVRVASVGSGYTTANVARVQRVVDSLRAKGYRAQMVAGSSETPVRFEVSGYPLPGEDDGISRGVLGTVEQSWPELGAVSRVDRAISSGNQMVAAVAIANATALFGTTFAIRQQARRRSARLLESIGWGARSVRRAFLREDSRAMAIMLLGALAAVGLSRYLSGGEVTAGTSMSVAAVIVAATVVLGSAAGAARSQAARGPRAPRNAHSDLARTSAGSGLLLAARRAHISVPLAIASGTLASACGTLAVVAQSTAAQMGSSRVAALVADSNTVAHYLLAMTSLAAAVLLLRSSVALSRPRIESQTRLLSSLGWTPRSIRAVRTTEVACSMLPGTSIGIGVTTALALAANQSVAISAGSAALGGIATCAVFLPHMARRPLHG